MDAAEFTDAQKQFLVAINRGMAYVPPPLPVEFEPTRALMLVDGDARGALGELVGESRRIQASLLLSPLRRREAVLSNVIEGTYTQVEDVLLSEAVAEATPTSPETTEVLRTLEAIEVGESWLNEGRRLNSSLILELHAALLRHARGAERNPGRFRARQVFLGNRDQPIEDARYVPPPPEQVPPLMDELSRFLGAPPTYGPLIDAALMHYQFEAIHPFEDGNGRLGRALIPLFLIQRGVVEKPVLYLGAYFAAHRDEYIEWLGAVSKRGAWDEWVRFFLEGVISESRDADARLRRVDSLISKYRALAGGASRSTVPLLSLEHVVERVFVSVSDIARLTATSSPTARGAIATLEEIGVLRRGPRVRGAQYWVAQEVIDELYEM